MCKGTILNQLKLSGKIFGIKTNSPLEIVAATDQLNKECKNPDGVTVTLMSEKESEKREEDMEVRLASALYIWKKKITNS